MRRRRLVLAIVATDRPESFARLVATAAPLSSDPVVAAFVLDNSGDARSSARIAQEVARWRAAAAGPRILARSPVRRAPLHLARRLLTAAVARSSLARESPRVWMLDDDLRFERVDVSGGALVIENVANARVSEIEAAAGADLLVGGFTGDPPIRPDAVQATQLGDLASCLELLARFDPDARYVRAPGPARTPDDYYDHAERAEGHLFERHPWLVRAGGDPRVGAQLGEVCCEAGRIIAGGTPFRPLLESHAPAPALTSTPRRGGNVVFLDWDLFLAHPYPSVRVPGGWSRRADMIGATLLARDRGARVLEGGLTLRHDRQGQQRASFDPTSLLRELAGVLLSRAVTRRFTRERLADELRELAEVRAARIDLAQKLALSSGARAVAALEDPGAWWTRHRHPGASALAANLREHLQRLESERGRAAPELDVDAIASHAATLLEPPSGAASEEVACAGG